MPRVNDQTNRWLPRDPIHTLVVLLAPLLAGVVLGGVVESVTNNSKPAPRRKTVIETVTVTAPAEAATEGEAPIGLEALNEEEAVGFDTFAELGNRNIGGEDYSNAVTMEIYPEGAGTPHLPIFTKGRFSTMTFTVGIDAEAECPKASAAVSVTDQDGRPLWGPRTATISKPISEEIEIPRPIQINLVQRSEQTESACINGLAEVSWGGVTFGSG